MDDLLPCPFCGSADVKITQKKSLFDVVCHECICTGPLSLTEKQAVEDWNTRDHGFLVPPLLDEFIEGVRLLIQSNNEEAVFVAAISIWSEFASQRIKCGDFSAVQSKKFRERVAVIRPFIEEIICRK